MKALPILLPLLFLMLGCSQSKKNPERENSGRSSNERKRTPIDTSLPPCLSAGSSGIPSSNKDLGVPESPPDRVGWIIAARNGTIRLTSDPCNPLDTTSSFIPITSAARIMQRTGHEASFELLGPGQKVSIWLDPQQNTVVTAVVIERIANWPPRHRAQP